MSELCFQILDVIIVKTKRGFLIIYKPLAVEKFLNVFCSRQKITPPVLASFAILAKESKGLSIAPVINEIIPLFVLLYANGGFPEGHVL